MGERTHTPSSPTPEETGGVGQDTCRADYLQIVASLKRISPLACAEHYLLSHPGGQGI